MQSILFCLPTNKIFMAFVCNLLVIFHLKYNLLIYNGFNSENFHSLSLKKLIYSRITIINYNFKNCFFNVLPLL